MSFLKRIFGEKRGEEAPPRCLDHPKDLQTGDILKFGFTAQKAVSNGSFTVLEVTTLDLGGEESKKTLFSLSGGQDSLRLAVTNDARGDRLEVGLSLLPDDVGQLFPLEAFVDLLDPDTGVHHVLERIAEPEPFGGWTAPVYRQEAGKNAYRYKGDYRKRLMPQDADAGHGLSYYYLVSDDRRHAIEVQVYDGGHTEVYLLAYLSASNIEELWPAAQSHA